jgi:tetratricopeptide (TPR) repeat protein
MHADAIVQTLERARGLAPARAFVAALVMLAAGAFAAGGEGSSALFIRANGLYGDGKYAEATAAYEQILAQGIESGAVQYNLGNAYLKAGDVGHAVLAGARAGSSRAIPTWRRTSASPANRRDVSRRRSSRGSPSARGAPLHDDARDGRAAIAWWILWLALGLGALVPAAPASRGLADRERARVRPPRVVRRLALVDARASDDSRRRRARRRDRALRAEPTATRSSSRRPGPCCRRAQREDAALVTSRDGRRGWLTSSALATL